MRIGYTARESGELTGIPHTTISYWAQQELYTPDISNAGKRGVARIYSKRNIFEMLVIRQLSESGLKLAQIKGIIFFLSQNMDLEVYFNKDSKTNIVDESEVLLLLEIYNHLSDNPEYWFSFMRNLDNIPWRDYKVCFKAYNEKNNKFNDLYMAVNLMSIVRFVNELPSDTVKQFVR